MWKCTPPSADVCYQNPQWLGWQYFYQRPSQRKGGRPSNTHGHPRWAFNKIQQRTQQTKKRTKHAKTSSDGLENLNKIVNNSEAELGATKGQNTRAKRVNVVYTVQCNDWFLWAFVWLVSLDDSHAWNQCPPTTGIQLFHTVWETFIDWWAFKREGWDMWVLLKFASHPFSKVLETSLIPQLLPICWLAMMRISCCTTSQRFYWIETISSSLKCWWKAGWIHVFMLFMPNSNPTSE